MWTSLGQRDKPQVVDALYDAHVAGIEEVQTGSVAQAVWVLRRLGREDKADELADTFFHCATPVGSYDGYPFHEMIIDEKFIERWKEHTDNEAPDERDIDSTIQSFYTEKGSTIDDIKRLSQFSADDFYRWFTTTENRSVLNIAKALANILYRLGSLVTETNRIETEVRAALQRISAESKINQIRLRSLLPTEAPASRERG